MKPFALTLLAIVSAGILAIMIVTGLSPSCAFLVEC